VTLNELVRMIGRLTGRTLEPHYEAPRAGDVRHSLAGIDKAGRLLGYAPSVTLEEGLRRTIAWLTSDGAA